MHCAIATACDVHVLVGQGCDESNRLNRKICECAWDNPVAQACSVGAIQRLLYSCGIYIYKHIRIYIIYMCMYHAAHPVYLPYAKCLNPSRTSLVALLVSSLHGAIWRKPCVSSG